MDPSPDVLACRVVDGLVVEQVAAGRVVVGVDLGTSGGVPLDKVRQSGPGGLEDWHRPDHPNGPVQICKMLVVADALNLTSVLYYQNTSIRYVWI